MALKLPPFRRIVQVTAPIVAIFTLMIGLRVGAGEAVRAAVVFGAPPSTPGPDGKTRLAWQVLTFLDDRGVKETIPMRRLEIVARAKGQESVWKGDSNVDGIAEASFVFDGLVEGDDVDLEVRLPGEKDPLAKGRAQWSPRPTTSSGSDRPEGQRVRPTAERGAIRMQVAIEGERLVPGSPTPVWVYFTTESLPRSKVAIRALPEPGIVAEREDLKVCPGGWAEASLLAQAHVVGTKFVAKPRAPDVQDSKEEGEWFGVMPVAAGAFSITIDRVIEENRATAATLIAPNPRNVAYAEVQDRHGRIVAAALEPRVEAGDPMPRARLEIPPLRAGLYWVVASGEPRGGEHMTGAAIARAFVVGKGPEGAGIDTRDLCSVGPYLAKQHATGVKRWIALDGLPERSAKNRFRHDLGMGIAMLSLLAAALLEALLLVAASRETRIALQLAELDGDDEKVEAVTAKPPGGSLAVALLVAVLGFALLAALLVAKA
ncbi:MAG: hypothetical protein JST00_21980 [Deltaproteobacteria bacterium]|nr:hypothetical protein [Deltaproteobacteria bacterium]